MSHTPINEILALCKKRGFLKKDPNRLFVVADKVSRSGRALTTEALDRLGAHFASLDKDVESHTVAALADGTWIALAKDLAAEAGADKPQQKFSGTSGLRFVTADNPYGWSDDGQNGKALLALHRATLDHDRPGEWNAYRQCYNHPEQRLRRQGCSREEVIGGITIPPGWRPGQPIKGSEGRAPKLHFDPQELADAAATRRP